jgi:hypothetical protein
MEMLRMETAAGKQLRGEARKREKMLERMRKTARQGWHWRDEGKDGFKKMITGSVGYQTQKSHAQIPRDLAEFSRKPEQIDGRIAFRGN